MFTVTRLAISAIIQCTVQNCTSAVSISAVFRHVQHDGSGARLTFPFYLLTRQMGQKQTFKIHQNEAFTWYYITISTTSMKPHMSHGFFSFCRHVTYFVFLFFFLSKSLFATHKHGFRNNKHVSPQNCEVNYYYPSRVPSRGDIGHCAAVTV